MARILLIDDDTALLDMLSLAFEDAGYEVTTRNDGMAGMEVVEREQPDAVVSDVNMPALDGFALCRRLREANNEVPIVLLTSRDSEIDEALGLELGADDYVTKPFRTRILLARVAALLRRDAIRKGADLATPPREVGRLILDASRLEVRYGGSAIEVTVTEFRLVEVLTERPGVVLSRPSLLERIRGDDTVVAHRIIDTYVRRLRRKFEAVDSEFSKIETVVGAGYRWRDE